GSGLRAQRGLKRGRRAPADARCERERRREVGNEKGPHRAEFKKRPRLQANAKGVSEQGGGECKEAPPSGVKEAPAAASERRRREGAARWRMQRGSTERSERSARGRKRTPKA